MLFMCERVKIVAARCVEQQAEETFGFQPQISHQTHLGFTQNGLARIIFDFSKT
jgi:hypothetical protein